MGGHRTLNKITNRFFQLWWARAFFSTGNVFSAFQKRTPYSISLNCGEGGGGNGVIGYSSHAWPPKLIIHQLPCSRIMWGGGCYLSLFPPLFSSLHYCTPLFSPLWLLAISAKNSASAHLLFFLFLHNIVRKYVLIPGTGTV